MESAGKMPALNPLEEVSRIPGCEDSWIGLVRKVRGRNAEVRSDQFGRGIVQIPW